MVVAAIVTAMAAAAEAVGKLLSVKLTFHATTNFLKAQRKLCFFVVPVSLKLMVDG